MSAATPGRQSAAAAAGIQLAKTTYNNHARCQEGRGSKVSNQSVDAGLTSGKTSRVRALLLHLCPVPCLALLLRLRPVPRLLVHGGRGSSAAALGHGGRGQSTAAHEQP